MAADLKKLQDSVKAAEQASSAKQIEQDTRLSAMEDALRSLSSKAPAEMDTATDEAQPHATTESPAAPVRSSMVQLCSHAVQEWGRQGEREWCVCGGGGGGAGGGGGEEGSGEQKKWTTLHVHARMQSPEQFLYNQPVLQVPYFRK